MAAHYSVGILPARPGKPRDKAKVEAGVRFAQTYILGRLRGLNVPTISPKWEESCKCISSLDAAPIATPTTARSTTGASLSRTASWISTRTWARSIRSRCDAS